MSGPANKNTPPAEPECADLAIALENCEHVLEKVQSLFAAMWMIAQHASREEAPFVVKTLQGWKVISDLALMGEYEAESTLDAMPKR